MPNRAGPLRHQGMAVSVQGLGELRRALAKAEGNTAKRLRKELRDIANDVRDTARAGVSHKTGRHGNSGSHLADTIKATTAGSGASVYSNAPHSIVQDSGGQVGHGTILKRGEVSRYMTEAVNDARPYVARRMETLLDELSRDFEEE